jgi:hypothetical protein
MPRIYVHTTGKWDIIGCKGNKRDGHGYDDGRERKQNETLMS